MLPLAVAKSKTLKRWSSTLIAHDNHLESFKIHPQTHGIKILGKGPENLYLPSVLQVIMIYFEGEELPLC